MPQSEAHDITHWFWADDPAWNVSGADVLFRYTLPADLYHVGTQPVVCPAQPCQSNGTCSLATGGCLYTPQPDGTPCSDGYFFDYDPGYFAVEYLDQCQAGTCVAGPHANVWRDFDGSCVDERGSAMPSYWKVQQGAQ